MGKRVRGFEVAKGYELEGIHLPVRKTSKSAGYDIESFRSVTIRPNKMVIIETGVKAYMKDDEYLAVHLRSSMGIKRELRLANGTGIIDADYYNNPDNDGHILIAVVNMGASPIEIKAGECIAQGIFTKYLLTDDDSATTVRVGGVGSTDEQ